MSIDLEGCHRESEAAALRHAILALIDACRYPGSERSDYVARTEEHLSQFQNPANASCPINHCRLCSNLPLVQAAPRFATPFNGGFGDENSSISEPRNTGLGAVRRLVDGSLAQIWPGDDVLCVTS